MEPLPSAIAPLLSVMMVESRGREVHSGAEGTPREPWMSLEVGRKLEPPLLSSGVMHCDAFMFMMDERKAERDGLWPLVHGGDPGSDEWMLYWL
mmetsp:Transcript_36630/g.101729  ORF Transcript_36630/g.101729 Transcript_36630/m.101729 type:complete len:94 (-) Transcript_36630:221-502(-)